MRRELARNGEGAVPPLHCPTTGAVLALPHTHEDPKFEAGELQAIGGSGLGRRPR